jgi:glutaredoxin
MENKCLSCGISENDIPLVQLAFDGGQRFICPQCLHTPRKLADKLPVLKDVKLAPHKHE